MKARRKLHLLILNSEDSENYFRLKLQENLPETSLIMLKKRLVLYETSFFILFTILYASICSLRDIASHVVLNEYILRYVKQ